MFEKKKSVWLFLLPGLAMLMIFYIVPFFSGIGYSLTDGSYKNTFVGLQNYRDLWQNSMFLLGLKNTMELSLICAPLVEHLGHDVTLYGIAAFCLIPLALTLIYARRYK